jgi:uncharacterized membrane protein (DUF106 family)
MLLQNPCQDIFLWALIISFVISLIYRIFTKPEEMRKIKEEMKFYREKSKEAQKQKDMKKANEYLNEMMKLSQKQMRYSMKPMFISLGIVFIILGFISQTYASVFVETKPISETSEIGYFAFASFNHSLKIEKANEVKVYIDTNNDGEFDNEVAYSKGELAKINNMYWVIEPIEDNKVKMDIVIRFPFRIPIFGWTHTNWLIWYILVSLPATWIFRKALGVE